jgi:hypothetical protein
MWIFLERVSETGFWRSRHFARPLYSFAKNSGKHRKTAGRFAVISAAEAAAAKDFRREPDLARCKFAARTAKTAKKRPSDPSNAGACARMSALVVTQTKLSHYHVCLARLLHFREKCIGGAAPRRSSLRCVTQGIWPVCRAI